MSFRQHINTMEDNFRTMQPDRHSKLPKAPLAHFQKDKTIKNHSQHLYNNGQVVYGRLVQANTLLFKKGPLNHPACMVFSTDDYYKDNPNELAKIASTLFSYKNHPSPPSDIKHFVDVISDESTFIFNELLPHTITDGRMVYYTTIMIIRKHLPTKKLDSMLVPIICCPDDIITTFVLPHYYWTEGYTEFFIK